MLGLVALAAAWVAGVYGMGVTTAQSGGWLLCAVLVGVITCFIGVTAFMVGMISDDYIGFNKAFHYFYLAAFGAAVLGGGGLAIYAIAALIWRGAGIHIEVTGG